MPVYIRYAGRTGNNVIQYAMGRRMAEDNDLLLETPWPNPHLFEATPCASGALEAGIKPSLYQRLDEDHPVEFGRVYPAGTQYVLDGYWQNGHYHIPYRQRIRDYFRFPIATFDVSGMIHLDYDHTVKAEDLPRNTEDLGVHVRLTDGATLGGVNHIVKPEWYDHILSDIAKNYRRVIVFTDDKFARDMFLVFDKYKAIIKSQDVSKDFIEMMTFTDFVLAPSTFSWCTCFLGHSTRAWQLKKFVVLPNVKNMALPWAEQVEGKFINER